MSDVGPLAAGGRVVIIGGGPGGVACALALQNLSLAARRPLQISIFEQKQFSGGQHHNLCAGVMSPPLPQLLSERLGLAFPGPLDHRPIEGYVLHNKQERITLVDRHEPSQAVRRVLFDNYMLEAARERGITIIRARVLDLDLHPDRVLVYSESVPLEADVVVGAFGMDEGTAAIFRRKAGYRPPEPLDSVVTRYYPGPEAIAGFGAYIHAYLRFHPGIEFGAITPKEDHLTINIAGQGVTDTEMEVFLGWPEVRSILPGMKPDSRHSVADLPLFKGRIPSSLARDYFGDRYVVVGDAAGLVRAFKGKGVTSAVLTGIRAAETIVQAGISRPAFEQHYAAANRDISGDLIYGWSTRRLVRAATRLGLMAPVLRAGRSNRAVEESLFGAVSAELPYRDVLSGLFRPRSVLAILRSLARTNG